MQGELFPIDPWGSFIPAAPVALCEEDVLPPINPQPTHNNKDNLYCSETQYEDIYKVLNIDLYTCLRGEPI